MLAGAPSGTFLLWLVGPFDGIHSLNATQAVV
jgi:hypothetical protein